MIFATAPNWVKDAVFYQIFPERFANGDPENDPPSTALWGLPPSPKNFFGGDLQGILDRLPYLEDLGANGLYLTPVFKANSNHKYDTCDYLQVDPAFGTNELLKRLVDSAHTRGIRVILDAVFNHCGDGFWAFQDVMAHGAASRYAGWFFLSLAPNSAPPYQTCGGAPFLPKLNLQNPEVRAHLLHVARYWIETCDIDGWRLDVPWKAPLDFWREFRQVVKSTKTDAYIVAEAWRDTAYWLAGDTCDAVMNYPLRDYILDYCVRDAMDAEDFDFFTSRLRVDQGLANAFQLNLLGSHDTARLLTLCGGNAERAVLAATAQFTLPGAPMIYYGDEVGLEGANDPDCRRCMPWDSSRWNEILLTAYRRLIGARRTHPALRSGSVEPLLVFNGVYAFRRSLETDEVIIVLNPRNEQRGLSVPLSGSTSESREWRDLATGCMIPSVGGSLVFDSLPAKTALVMFPV